MIKNKPIIAIMYDFDKTLATTDMQNFSFIPALGLSSEEFWDSVADFTEESGMENILSYMYIMIEKCRENNIPLTKEYLNNLFESQNGLCAITGDSLEDINKASLDRINSNKPYIEGNVQWVTVQANKSKHILSMQELYEFCHKVLNHANQQPSQEI